MSLSLAVITLWVNEHEEALKFYTEKLGFDVKNNVQTESFRWVTVSAPGTPSVGFSFMKPSEEETPLVGKGFFGLQTSDARSYHEKLKKEGVKVGEIAENSWALDFQFEDLYGNKFNVREKKPQPK